MLRHTSCCAPQVVFATETLAAGINMPARSTVLSTISRRRDAMHALLQHNELLQMAGRAGRRGYDTIGAAGNWRRECYIEGDGAGRQQRSCIGRRSIRDHHHTSWDRIAHKHQASCWRAQGTA